MLNTSPIIGFIPTKDAIRARTFFEHTLGLRFIADDDFALVLSANGIMIRIVRVGDFTPFPFTILGWEVEDIEQEVAILTDRGVHFNRYDFLEQTTAGIWTAPDKDKVAWFTDPDGNILSLSQHVARVSTSSD
jgi:catechol 2,3-dioxygenase-like lactoylglutathione lyase family enzyme